MTYITPHKSYAHIDRLAAWKSGEKPAPVTVEFDLSNRCSLGCQSCHFAHTHTRGPWSKRDRALPVLYDQPGDLADTDMVIRALGEMADACVKAVVWSGGGEPTLHPDWQSIAMAASGHGLKQGMYTLGGHLTPASASRLSSLADWVVVSLDCPDAKTYEAEKGVAPARFIAACKGVQMLADAGECVVGVSFLLHAGNWTRMDEMVSLGKKLGATYVTLRPTIDTSPDDPATITSDREWVTSALPMLTMLSEVEGVECDPARFEAYRDWSGRSYHTCHAIKLNATVTPDGRIWVCPQRRGIPDSCVGDLTKESFREAWDRHVGQWTDFGGCRAMCRLHLVNEAIAPLFEDYPHEAFV